MTTPPSTNAAAAATRELALSLQTQLAARPGGNVMLSPYSLWLALAMLLPGARGAARSELADSLGLPDDHGLAPLTELTRELATRAQPTATQQRMVDQGFLQAANLGFLFEVANQLWVQTGWRLDPAYGTQLTAVFGIDPATADFAGAPDAAVAAINRWVADRTRGKIPSLVDRRSLPPELRAVLANAILFRAAWGAAFPAAATRPGGFKLADGTTADVPMMRRTSPLAYAEDADFVAVQLPYSHDAVAMTIIVPRGDAAPARIPLDALVARLAVEQIDLALPRFRFESSHALVESLRAAGFAAALAPDADYAGISTEPGFAVGEVLHRTSITVDEQGTEAAAATVMLMPQGGPPPTPPTPRSVVVDRPFSFVIRDVPTGTALFFGRVVDPR